MATEIINKKEELIMKLVHYFITEKNYNIIVVNGVKDEIWMESMNAPYRIIRINSNYIHNDEQYNYDIFKTKNIMKQIKKKTLSFSVNALNIFIDANPNINFKEDKAVSSVRVEKITDIKKKNGLSSMFPDITEKLSKDAKGVDLIINVTKDINEKTEKDNKIYEDTFKPKKILVTPILIAINIFIFILIHLGLNSFILNGFANDGSAIRAGEIYRLLTSAFLHYDLFHLLFNMYALYIIGNQIETFVGKSKFVGIYLASAITGSLMSIIINNNASIGASGAIFGLMGSLVYFGYHYRLYLGQTLKTQIIPLLVINLALGFMISGIDVSAHIGGLVGGLLITMALGLKGKTTFSENINGIIVFSIYTIFLIVMAFFVK